MVNLLPSALFAFFIAYLTYEAVHLFHSPVWRWHWKRTAKGCLEAFVFLVAAMPLVIVSSMLSERICDQFGCTRPEKIELEKLLWLGFFVSALTIWNAWRLLHLRAGRSSVKHRAPDRRA